MAASPPLGDSPEWNAPRDRRGLIIIIALAAVQGLVLFGLHRAVARAVWPATNDAVLVSLYLNAVFLPLTAQLLVRFVGQARLRWSLVAMAVALTAFGWHAAYVSPVREPRDFELAFAHVPALTVLWLIVVAFLRAQLETGRNSPEYRALFAAAWRNKLTLAEASVFVGVVWLLLGLWAALFGLLEIEFFSDLFFQPAFVYPATAIAIGMALHLIGSVDRIVDVVLTQVLSLFKWLAPLAGLIVVLFAFALVPELPRLFAADERPLNALWLLWLVAVTILLINAAYQDGSAERPYGAKLSLAMRLVPPLLTVIALTATYALYVRMSAYGVTLGRFWGFVTACVGLAHAAAATIAAVRPGPWLGTTSKTNPLLAAALAAVLILALTPALSPYRLSAASQQRIALEAGSTPRRDGALRYLRFESGRYGRDALHALTERTGDAPTEELAAAARRTEEQLFATSAAPPIDFDAWFAQLRAFPADRTIPPALVEVMRASASASMRPSWSSYALWVDAAGGPELELLVIISYSQYWLYAEDNGTWRLASQGFTGSDGGLDTTAIDSAIAAGDFAAVPPELREIRIGRDRLRLSPQSDPVR
jgi:hypothetical protein